MKHLIACALCVLVTQHAALSQGLATAKPSFKVGNWTVHRSTDPMTDKASCTGIYKTNAGIQLAQGGFYVRVSGGIQSVELRFDDKPALPMRLAEKMEKDVRAVIFNSAELAEAVAATRIRMQVLTMVSGIFTADLDVTGIGAAYEHIRACPAGGAVAPAVPAKSAFGECSEAVFDRLLAAGVTKEQIAAACRV